MRYSKDGWSVELGLEKGRPAPEWYLDKPELDSSSMLYLYFFNQLSSCRSVGMGIGPIPWTAIITYAEFREFNYRETITFVNIIQLLDSVFLEEANKDK